MSVSIVGPFVANPFAQTSGHDDTLHRVYYELCRGMQPGAKARFAFYMWNDDDGDYSDYNPHIINTAFINAYNTAKEQNNACDVKLLLDVDHYSEDPEDPNYDNARAYRMFSEAFGSSNVITVKKKAWSQGEDAGFAMHMKLITMSSVHFDNECVVDELKGKTLEYVVTVSSGNIWGETQYYSANDLVLFHGDKAFYDNAVSRWDQAKKDATPSSGYCEGFTTNAQSHEVFDNVKWYYFPLEKTKDDDDGDIVVSTVNNMATAMDTFDSWLSRTLLLEDKTNVRVAASYFNDNRMPIATKLGAVDDYYHCDVKAVVRNHGGSDSADSFEAVNAELASHGIETTILPDDANASMPLFHSKFMTFRGRYPIDGSTKYRKLIWTGSENYTYEALRKNAETMVRIEDDDVYDTYKSHFDDLLEATWSRSAVGTAITIAVIVLAVIAAAVLL